MGRPDEAPDDPRHDQPADHVAGPDMHFEEVVLGQIGDGEGHDQGPVE